MCLKIDVESILRRKKERERERNMEERGRERMFLAKKQMLWSVRSGIFIRKTSFSFVRSLRGKN